MREFGDIGADLAALDNIATGETRLGVIGTTGRWLMPQFLTKLQESHPGVHPIISEGGTSTLIPRLITGHIDAAIVHLPVDDSELIIEPLFAEDLVLLVHGSHPWSSATTLPFSALGEYPLLLPRDHRLCVASSTALPISVAPHSKFKLKLMAYASWHRWPLRGSGLP